MGEKSISIANQDDGLQVAVRDAVDADADGNPRVVQLMQLVAPAAGMVNSGVTLPAAMSASALDGLFNADLWFDESSVFYGCFSSAVFYGTTGPDYYDLAITATSTTITATLSRNSATVATATASNSGGFLVFQVDGVDFLVLHHAISLPVGSDPAGEVTPSVLQSTVVTVGDRAALTVYGAFSAAVTEVVVTPLLLDAVNAVIGMLPAKTAAVSGFTAGGNYIMQALTWSELAGHNKFAFHVTYTGEATAWLTVAVL